MRIVLRLVVGLLLVFVGIAVGLLSGIGFSLLATEAIAAVPVWDQPLKPAEAGRGSGVAAYEIVQGATVWRVACRGGCDPIVSKIGKTVWRVRVVDGEGRIIEDRRAGLLIRDRGTSWRRSEGSSLLLWEGKP